MPSGAILKRIKNLQCRYFLFLNKVKLETAYKWSALLFGPRGRCPAGRRSSPLRGRRRCCCRVCRLALAHGGVLIWRPAWRSSRSRSRPGPPPAQRRQSGWLGTRRVAPSPFVAAQRRRPPHRAPDFLTLEARLALKSPAPSGPPSHVQRNDVTSELVPNRIAPHLCLPKDSLFRCCLTSWLDQELIGHALRCSRRGGGGTQWPEGGH